MAPPASGALNNCRPSPLSPDTKRAWPRRSKSGSSAEAFADCADACVDARGNDGEASDGFVVCNSLDPPDNEGEVDAWAEAMATGSCDTLCLIDP